MMKRLSKVTLLLILALIAVNSLVLAKKTKLNLKMFDSPPDFSSDVSSASGIMGSRYRPNPPVGVAPGTTSYKYVPQYAPVVSPLTPDWAKTYKAKPLIEWNRKICSPERECKVSVFVDGISVVNHKTVKKNYYVFDKELIPGTGYEFKLINYYLRPRPEFSLKFYVLDKEKQEQLSKSLKDIKADDKYSKKILELEMLYKNGLWFDVVDRLNKLIKKYPDDKTLLTFKRKLYRSVKK